jgi:hypothetical protein
VVYQKAQLFQAVLKDNCQVDDSAGVQLYQRMDALTWNEIELQHCKQIKIRDFPKDCKVRCIRVEVSTYCTDFVVTNDKARDSTEATQEVCGFRWQIEQSHREAKQVTVIERCKCRMAHIQHNHVGCALLVWVRFKELAMNAGTTIYQLKQGLLDDYLVGQLRSPAIKMVLA